MRRTRKWAFVAQEATRLAGLGLTPLDIATRLDVAKSTVTRWMAVGKLQRPATTSVAVRPGQTPAEWSQAVRDAFDLDATDDQLVGLAEAALSVSKDLTVSPSVRLTAAGRFQAVVKQLALVARKADAVPVAPVETPKRKLERVIRRSSVDPRTQLMAVK